MTQTHNNSQHNSNFLKRLLTWTISHFAFLNFLILALTFSSVSFVNYFNPGIVSGSTTTKGWANSQRPSRPLAWDLWKRNFFLSRKNFQYLLKISFPNCFHTYQQLKIDLREHILHDPAHLFWINDEQWQSALGSISLHQSSLSSHFRSKDWKFDDLFSFSLKLGGWSIMDHGMKISNTNLPSSLQIPSAKQTLSVLLQSPCLVPSPTLPSTRQPA